MSEEIKIIELKELDNALDLLMDFNREIKIYKTEEEMKKTSEKFLKLGNPIGIVQEGKLIAYFNLYCNNYETLEAYFGNLYVLKEYRKQGLSKKLVYYSFDFAKEKGFKKVMLNVAKDNVPAIKLYEGCGFEYTGESKIMGDEDTHIMCKII